ncbi:MAG: hypothetical protein ACRC1U_01240, partial [Vibrionaceae bacterium]
GGGRLLIWKHTNKSYKNYVAALKMVIRTLTHELIAWHPQEKIQVKSSHWPITMFAVGEK